MLRAHRCASDLEFGPASWDTSGVSLPKTISAAEACEARRVAARAEAEEVSAFLLQPGLFGTPLTPGEMDEFRTHPAATVGCADDAYWYVRDGAGPICAVIGAVEVLKTIRVSRSGWSNRDTANSLAPSPDCRTPSRPP